MRSRGDRLRLGRLSFLQRQLETRLAKALIAGEIPEGKAVKFTVKDDALVLGRP